MYQQQFARRRLEATSRLGQKQHHILALVEQGPFDQINRENPSLASATIVFSKSCAWAGPHAGLRDRAYVESPLGLTHGHVIDGIANGGN